MTLKALDILRAKRDRLTDEVRMASPDVGWRVGLLTATVLDLSYQLEKTVRMIKALENGTMTEADILMEKLSSE